MKGIGVLGFWGNVAVRQENDNCAKDSNSDTQMHDATAEEEKSSTHPSKNS